MNTDDDLGVAAGAAPVDPVQPAVPAFGVLPWHSFDNSWQHTTISDANDVPVVCFDLEDWAVTEETQDALEKRQAELAAFIVRAVNNHEAMREALAVALASLDEAAEHIGLVRLQTGFSVEPIRERARSAAEGARAALASKEK